MVTQPLIVVIKDGPMHLCAEVRESEYRMHVKSSSAFHIFLYKLFLIDAFYRCNVSETQAIKPLFV